MACTIAKGYIGLVPGSTQQGDLICIMYGSKSPFVLRKTVSRNVHAWQDEEDLFSLIGEVYSHGVMHGEAMNLQHLVLRPVN